MTGATIVQHAVSGDWTSVLKASVTTGIVVAQSASWDRAIGRALAIVFGDDEGELSLSTATAQALLTTGMGVSVIYVLHRCTR